MGMIKNVKRSCKQLLNQCLAFWPTRQNTILVYNKQIAHGRAFVFLQTLQTPQLQPAHEHRLLCSPVIMEEKQTGMAGRDVEAKCLVCWRIKQTMQQPHTRDNRLNIVVSSSISNRPATTSKFKSIQHTSKPPRPTPPPTHINRYNPKGSNCFLIFMSFKRVNGIRMVKMVGNGS